MEDLKRKFQIARATLICSFILDAVGLAALMLQWRGTIPIIIFACLFYLFAVGITKRQYNKIWYEKNTIALAEKQITEVSYTAKEKKEGNALVSLGFVPELNFVARDQFYHVLRGRMKIFPVKAAETAFVRKYRTEGRSIAGTLVRMENVLPNDERWVILWQHPLEGIVTHMEYEENGWAAIETPEVISEYSAECFSCGGEQKSLDRAAIVLSVYCKNMSAALSAEGGNITLFLPSVFYAQKPDPLKQPTPEMLTNGSVFGLEVMERLCISFMEMQEKSSGKQGRKT